VVPSFDSRQFADLINKQHSDDPSKQDAAPRGGTASGQKGSLMARSIAAFIMKKALEYQNKKDSANALPSQRPKPNF